MTKMLMLLLFFIVINEKMGDFNRGILRWINLFFGGGPNCIGMVAG